MQQIGLIRAINLTSEKYYGNTSDDINNHEKYLEECNQYLFGYLKATLADGFVFSALSYINYSTEKIELVKGEDEHTEYNFNTDNEPLKEELNTSLTAVLKGEMIGMTAILLSKNNNKDFFLIDSKDSCGHYQSIKGPDGNIFLMLLADMIYAEQYEDFKKVNELRITDFIANLKEEVNYEVQEVDKIGKYLWRYKRMSKCYNKPFYVHFIRPSFIDFDHNLLLSLATSICLTQEHLAFINLFIYRIVAQMAIELKSQQAKKELIKDHKHLMRNLSNVNSIIELKDKIEAKEDYTELVKFIEDKGIIETASLRALLTEFLYVRDSNDAKLGDFKEHINSYSKIIAAFHKTLFVRSHKTTLQNIETLTNSFKNQLEDDKIEKTVILVFNIYLNGRKHSPDAKVKVNVRNDGNKVIIDFSNTLKQNHNSQFFNKKNGQFLIKDTEREGLTAIHKITNELGVKYFASENIGEFTLSITI